jgi:hypothetical protein
MEFYLNKREFNVVMKKLFEVVGGKFTSIEKDCSTSDWFMQCTWTIVQEEEFEKWLTKYLTSKLDLPPKAIRKRVDMFCFNYGWKYKK